MTKRIPVEVAASLRLRVSGAPRTKKNSRVHTRSGIPLPSKAWRKWKDTAQIFADHGELLTAAGALYRIGPWDADDTPEAGKRWVPLCDAMNVRATFYRDALRGDAVGFYQGLADLLEARGIITDDKHLVSWDGSRLLVDRANPRVELILEPVLEG